VLKARHNTERVPLHHYNLQVGAQYTFLESGWSSFELCTGVDASSWPVTIADGAAKSAMGDWTNGTPGRKGVVVLCGADCTQHSSSVDRCGMAPVHGSANVWCRDYVYLLARGLIDDD
jgi:hypothetical protein